MRPSEQGSDNTLMHSRRESLAVQRLSLQKGSQPGFFFLVEDFTQTVTNSEKPIKVSSISKTSNSA